MVEELCVTYLLFIMDKSTSIKRMSITSDHGVQQFRTLMRFLFGAMLLVRSKKKECNVSGYCFCSEINSMASWLLFNV